MLTPKDILGYIHGGRVLDAATGNGGFIHFLLDGLQDYTEIIGIDANERYAAAFTQVFKETPNIRFEMMDALNPGYPAESFDTVCLSNSLHHFDDPRAVLGQIMRMLRPGGHLILAEMYRDGQTETQLTHVHLHHWWAAVDRAASVIHHETSQRTEIIKQVDELGLSGLRFFDLSDTNEDPNNPEILTELNPVIDRYIQRAIGYPDLQARGEELRTRLSNIGFHSASTLIAVGVKPI